MRVNKKLTIEQREFINGHKDWTARQIGTELKCAPFQVQNYLRSISFTKPVIPSISKKQEAFIKANYKTMTDQAIGDKLKKSKSDICNFRNRNGLEKRSLKEGKVIEGFFNVDLKAWVI